MSKKKKKDSPLSNTPEGAVVRNPVEGADPVFMAEEATDTLAHVRTAVKSEIKAKIDSLAGRTASEAESALANMMAAKEIGGFVILQPGQSFISDYVADRVQVFVSGGEVKTIQVG